MFDPSLHILFMLGAAAFAAGFVDPIAGGGGLITIPTLLLAGMPPVEALGTDKLQGLFGPGTGSFYMLAFVSLAGFGVLKATAHTKLFNCATNIGAFVVFALAGAVSWKIGLLMGAAQFLGARLGAGLAIRNGAKIIKPLLVVVCVALAVKLLADPANPLRVAIGF